MTDRKPLIAANWKMNLSLREAAQLIRAVSDGIKNLEDMEVMVAAPFTSLGAVRQAIGNGKILLAAQNMHWEMSGAYTGEISGKMLQEAGCTHVILGHSERRIHFKETNDMIDRKVKAAISLGLVPILCIGESLEERESGQTFQIVEKQLNESSVNLRVNDEMPPSTILAYEPVWAIGTGKTATPAQAQEMHEFIRHWIQKNFGHRRASQVRILYGGSVKPENTAELMAKPDIDGALVGGASLQAESFLKIVRFKNA